MKSDNTQVEDIKRAMFGLLHRHNKLHISSMFKEEISHQEFFVLETIDTFMAKHTDLPGIYVSSLAKQQRASAPGVSRTLKSLEEKGLIEREVDTNDRRNVYVRMTSLGQQTKDGITQELNDFASCVIERMGVEQSAELVLLWTTLSDIMQDEIQQRQARNKTIKKGKEEQVND